MCGIVGILNFHGRPVEAPVLRRATDSLRHRGPDDEGFTLIRRATGASQSFAGPASPDEVRGALPSVESAGGWAAEHQPDLAMGHRRFAIISPTPDGHQPFWDRERRLCLAFNGEIYNYVEVRAELQRLGHHFRTASDTEVLLEAYRAWGTRCFERLNGMWAVAIYDTDRRELVLSRDRTGERPLYWLRDSRGVRFASEIRALLLDGMGAGAPAASASAVHAFVSLATSDLDTQTFFEGVHSVPAATVVQIGMDGEIRQRRFWEVPSGRLGDEMAPPVRESAAELQALLRDSIRLRLRADVPVNVALSGGMDSSSVAAFAAQLVPGVNTYTVRFEEKHSNEYPFAAAVAAHAGVQNLVVDPPKAWMLEYLPGFVDSMEEPFHAPDLLTDHVVRRMLAERGYKVSLSGIGGDELFAGYGLYRWLYANELKQAGQRWGWARELLLASDGAPRQALARRALAPLRRLRGAGGGALPDLAPEAFPGLAAHASLALPTTCDQRLRADVESLLLPYWLRSGDKSSMAVPMEVRYPFLDHRLIEFAVRLPLSQLIHNGWMKWILRKATEDVLPRHVVWRRTKMGFPYPIREWMLQSRSALQRVFDQADNPFLAPSFWSAQLDRAIHQNPHLVWRALSLELWHRRFIRGLPVLPEDVASPRTPGQHAA